MEKEKLEQAIQEWKEAAERGGSASFIMACLDAVRALEIWKETGVAVCSCCFKPLTGVGKCGMTQQRLVL